MIISDHWRIELIATLACYLSGLVNVQLKFPPGIRVGHIDQNPAIHLTNQAQGKGKHIAHNWIHLRSNTKPTPADDANKQHQEPQQCANNASLCWGPETVQPQACKYKFSFTAKSKIQELRLHLDPDFNANATSRVLQGNLRNHGRDVWNHQLFSPHLPIGMSYGLNCLCARQLIQSLLEAAGDNITNTWVKQGAPRIVGKYFTRTSKGAVPLTVQLVGNTKGFDVQLQFPILMKATDIDQDLSLYMVQ
jgi:hypothetical protein